MGLTFRFVGWFLCWIVAQSTMWQYAAAASGTLALGCAPLWVADVISSVLQSMLQLTRHLVVAHAQSRGAIGCS